MSIYSLRNGDDELRYGWILFEHLLAPTDGVYLSACTTEEIPLQVKKTPYYNELVMSTYRNGGDEYFWGFDLLVGYHFVHVYTIK